MTQTCIFNKWLSSPFQTNEDLIIFCDGSNYEVVTTATGSQTHRNKVITSIVGSEHWVNFASCHASTPTGGQAPMAITMSSDWLDLRGYTDERNIWRQMGSVGEPPDQKDFRRPRGGTPNTMDLCVWYLLEKQEEEWPKIEKVMVDKVRDESFILGLRNNDKPVDALSTTLGATLLHELTHTNLGGGMMDQGNGNCYGWVCVGNLKDASNPDSVNMLGVVLKLWTLGFYVNDAGRVEPING
ncbi:uncharacterized protein PG998_012230 [Apiospora kogelbergensis]|uniref:uncharacterized protein n=1 Tax=Apiospora kogelbergensis TaxID=1337665 RepID=UPI00312D76D9